MNQADVLDELLVECADDHVGLWQLIRAVREDLGICDPSEIRKVTMELVRTLLATPGITVGIPAPDGRHFVPWESASNEASRIIEQQWEALGREPDIGEIAWFTGAEGNSPP